MSSSGPVLPASASITQPLPTGVRGSVKRLLFIDNLRWLMIVFVITMHAADTYSPLGNWYYTDRTKLSLPVLLTFAAWQMFLQSFFMGLLFFIAGFFVPGSFDRKGPAKFFRDRANRLGLPVLFYMFVLGPITEYYFAHSWSAPYSFAHEWIHHIADWEFLSENGPLWFCLALLIFCAVYVLVKLARSNVREAHTGDPPGTARLVCFCLVIAALTFLVRLVQPSGTSFLNMQLGDFPQYILLFAAGIHAARKGWLLMLPYRAGLRWGALSLTAGFAAWIAILFAGGALQGNTRAYSGGWYWQSAAINLWEAFTGIGLCFGFLVLFREKFNSQGPLARFLSKHAFRVYIFHPPVFIFFARILTHAAWHPLVKFVALTCVSTLGTFVLCGWILRPSAILRGPGRHSVPATRVP